MPKQEDYYDSQGYVKIDIGELSRENKINLVLSFLRAIKSLLNGIIAKFDRSTDYKLMGYDIDFLNNFENDLDALIDNITYLDKVFETDNLKEGFLSQFSNLVNDLNKYFTLSIDNTQSQKNDINELKKIINQNYNSLVKSINMATSSNKRFCTQIIISLYNVIRSNKDPGEKKAQLKDIMDLIQEGTNIQRNVVVSIESKATLDEILNIVLDKLITLDISSIMCDLSSTNPNIQEVQKLSLITSKYLYKVSYILSQEWKEQNLLLEEKQTPIIKERELISQEEICKEVTEAEYVSELKTLFLCKSLNITGQIHKNLEILLEELIKREDFDFDPERPASFFILDGSGVFGQFTDTNQSLLSPYTKIIPIDIQNNDKIVYVPLTNLNHHGEQSKSEVSSTKQYLKQLQIQFDIIKNSIDEDNFIKYALYFRGLLDYLNTICIISDKNPRGVDLDAYGAILVNYILKKKLNQLIDKPKVDMNDVTYFQKYFKNICAFFAIHSIVDCNMGGTGYPDLRPDKIDYYDNKTRDSFELPEKAKITPCHILTHYITSVVAPKITSTMFTKSFRRDSKVADIIKYDANILEHFLDRVTYTIEDNPDLDIKEILESNNQEFLGLIPETPIYTYVNRYGDQQFKKVITDMYEAFEHITTEYQKPEVISGFVSPEFDSVNIQTIEPTRDFYKLVLGLVFIPDEIIKIYHNGSLSIKTSQDKYLEFHKIINFAAKLLEQVLTEYDFDHTNMREVRVKRMPFLNPQAPVAGNRDSYMEYPETNAILKNNPNLFIKILKVISQCVRDAAALYEYTDISDFLNTLNKDLKCQPEFFVNCKFAIIKVLLNFEVNN